MGQRSFIILAAAIAALLVGAVGVYAYDKTRDDVIADGVTAAGVDLSGMHPDEARSALRRELAQPLSQPVTVSYRGERFQLSAKRAQVRVDVDAMVDHALDASRSGNILSRTTRTLTGGSVDDDVAAAVSYSQPAVRRFVKRVARNVDQRARNAHVAFSGDSLGKIKERDGRRVERIALADDVRAQLARPTRHVVSVPVSVTHPKVTTAQLARKYPTVVTIDRSSFTLYLWKNLKKSKTYTVALGRQGLETPAGLYDVQDKQVNPSWHVPNSSWAGSLAGRVIPPGPQDPIKARWMGINGGAGIHGTDDVGSLGTAASHGCIRMGIPDVIDLYGRVSVHDPVYIA